MVARDADQYGDQQKDLVNAVMNFRFCKMLGNPSVAAKLASSQEGLISFELEPELSAKILTRKRTYLQIHSIHLSLYHPAIYRIFLKKSQKFRIGAKCR
jgi:hypothetical protein